MVATKKEFNNNPSHSACAVYTPNTITLHLPLFAGSCQSLYCGNCKDSDLIPSFRRLYEEAMTKGYVETSVTKCLILGAAGVGKTHLKHLLLKKDHPKQRVSTGLADNPVRAISFTWFVVEDGDWA